MDGKRFLVTFPHKSLLCPYLLLCECHCHRSLYTHSLSFFALPTQLSSPVSFFSKSLLLSSSQFLPLFFIPASIPCHLVYWKSLLLCLLVSRLPVPPSHRPTFLKTDRPDHITPSSGNFTSSLCHCLEQVSKLLLEVLDSKYFRLYKPKHGYYVSTYITT